MDICFEASLIKDETVEACIVPFFNDNGLCRLAIDSSLHELSEEIDRIISLGDFSAKAEEILSTYFFKQFQKRLIFVGLGTLEDLTLETVRRSLAKALEKVLSFNLKTVQLFVPEQDRFSDEEITSAMVETLFLMNYAFEGYKKNCDTKFLEKAVLIRQFQDSFSKLDTIKNMIKGVNLARDLVNKNADEINPEYLKDLAQSLQKQYANLKVTVLDRNDLLHEEMGLFLSVARASAQEPYFVIIEYKNAPQSEIHPVFIGKGITYDTGGLSLKPTTGMIDMKSDMGGSAVVLGVMEVLARQKLPVNVTAICAFAENSIGSNSYKIGDVYTGKAKISVEITNTDAEGRLALADSISYALEKLNPTHIVDIATLTGACEIALGSERAALFSNQKHFSDLIFLSGEKTSEKVWKMPLDKEYRATLNSKIADIKNSGKREGSLVASALFLKEFLTKDVIWAHLDIAGTTYLQEPRRYHRSRATGFGVRLLIEVLKQLYSITSSTDD